MQYIEQINARKDSRRVLQLMCGLSERSCFFRVNRHTFTLYHVFKKSQVKIEEWGGTVKGLFDNGFFTGINYWGSESAINMWENFNAESVENDFRLLCGARITHLRVFPLWPVFQPLKALYSFGGVEEYGFGEEPLPDTPAGRAGVSEEACRNFEVFCDLAEKYGLKLIVGLITGHMSFRNYAPPAFDGKPLAGNPTVTKWQLRFVKYFVARFAKKTAIVGWDLGNETSNLPNMNSGPDTFGVWCETIADAIKVCDGTRPVISGLAESTVEKGTSSFRMAGEVCDVHTTHPYGIFSTASEPLATMRPILDLPLRCRLGEDIGGVPTFVQEFGSIGYMNCSEKTEAEFYRAALLTSLAHGGHGVMWWCAFDQGHFGYAPYRWNTIGSEYGFFDKNMNEKPIVEVNRRFCEKLEKIPGRVLPKHTVNGTVIVEKDDGRSVDRGVLAAAYILAKCANMDVGFTYALDPIPDSPLYIFPCVAGNHSITLGRLNEILDRVRKGAVLYMSAHTGLFRSVPEITGTTFEYREKIDAVKTVRFGDRELCINTAYFLKPEETSAEILARDENGEGVFFKHKYGEGYVYFLTVPLEKHVAGEKGAYFKDDAPEYECIYRELAKASGAERAADSDNRFVRLTEHIIDERSLYIFAINYNNKPETASLTLNGDYDVTAVFGERFENNTLSICQNDGVLLKAVKRGEKM